MAFRVLSTTHINNYRKQARRPATYACADVSDQHLTDGRQYRSTLLRAADVEVLESLPDNEITSALDALAESFRMTIFYADVVELPYKDIAAIMDVPVGTVMSRLHRGRTQLRRLLAGIAAQRDYQGHRVPATS